MRPLPNAVLASFCIAAASLAGCIEFDEQEIAWSYDAVRDRLDVQIVYRGLASSEKSPVLFGRDETGEDEEGTGKQLDMLLEGRPIGALLVPWGAFDLAELRESKDVLHSAFARRVSIEHGEIFRAEDGRLCAWQHVRVDEFSEVLRLADAWMLRFHVEDLDAPDFREGLGIDDPESCRLLLEAVDRQEPSFSRVGSTLVMKICASEESAIALARRVEDAPEFKELVDESRRAAENAVKISDPPEITQVAAFLRVLGIDVVVREGGVDLVLGEPGQEFQRFRFPSYSMFETSYELLPHLTRKNIPIRTDVTDAALRERFESFRRG